MQNHHAASPPVPAVFCFESHEVRTVEQSGDVFFNVNDICSALTFKNPSQAIASHVDIEDLQKLEIHTPSGTQLTNYVNESGMYSLVMGSTKPEAKRFKKWVTSEVLPSIRKTGSYGVTVAPALPSNPVDYLLMVADAIRDQQSRTAQIESLALETAVKVDEINATKRLEDWQRFELKEAVDHKVALFRMSSSQSAPTLYRRTWGFVKNHFKVTTYAAIPATRFPEAKVIIDNCTVNQIGGNA